MAQLGHLRNHHRPAHRAFGGPVKSDHLGLSRKPHLLTQGALGDSPFDRIGNHHRTQATRPGCAETSP